MIPEETISAIDEMVDFSEDAVVSLGKYFWCRKEKVVVKKGSKRSREGTFKKGSLPNQIIWKRTSNDVKQEALESATALGSFARDNYYSVSLLNKEVEEKEQELHIFKKEQSQ